MRSKRNQANIRMYFFSAWSTTKSSNAIKSAIGTCGAFLVCFVPDVLHWTVSSLIADLMSELLEMRCSEMTPPAFSRKPNAYQARFNAESPAPESANADRYAKNYATPRGQHDPHDNEKKRAAARQSNTLRLIVRTRRPCPTIVESDVNGC